MTAIQRAMFMMNKRDVTEQNTEHFMAWKERWYFQNRVIPMPLKTKIRRP